jgi:type IVB pilus formation R64 PilN family outer membrane protein
MKTGHLLLMGMAQVVLLSGCALNKRLLDQVGVAVKEQAEIVSQHQNFQRIATQKDEKQRSQQVDRPWLVGRAVPLAREFTLPVALRARIDTTLMYQDGKIDLPTFAERVTRATGIAVRIKPEALLPAENFLPRLIISQANGSVAMPQTISLPQGSFPLSDVLDAASRRLSVQWRYHDRAIEFFRTQTRVFDLRVLSLSAQADARLGRSVSAKGSGFDHSSSTSFSGSTQHVMDAVKSRLEPFLTRAAVVAAQPGASSSVVITDTPEALTEISTYLERENRILTKRIRLIFEEITIATNEDSELGLDWDAVFAHGKFAASLASSPAATAVASTQARLGASTNAARSQAVLTALSKYGSIQRHVTIPVFTLNRRPVTHAVRTTFTYIDQVKSSTNGPSGHLPSGSVSPSISVTQKEETVGAFLTLLPDVQEDGQILLSVAYDNTVAQPLKSVIVGQESNRFQIQQITIDGHGTVQQIALKPGQPMLISGFDAKNDATDRSRVTAEAPLALGGSNRLKRGRTATVIMLTAQVEEGF